MNLLTSHSSNSSQLQEENALLKYRIEQLQNELISSAEYKRMTDRQLELFKNKASRFDELIRIGDNLKNRINFSIVFLKWLQNFSDSAYIEGVFLRKLFEFVFHLKELGCSSLGDSSSSPIEIVLFKKVEDKFECMNRFNEIVNYFQMLAAINVNSKQNPIKAEFCDYCFYSVEAFNDLTPAVKFQFLNGFDSLAVKFYAWKEHEFKDFNVNGLIMNEAGIYSSKEQSVISILEDISLKLTKFVERPDILQSKAFPTDKVLTKEQKQKYLLPMYDLISGKWLKIIESQYNLYGKIPLLFIERDEECIITNCKPPYPIVVLTCGHKISLMAYKGILFSENTSTEAVKCPLCRKDLIIDFDTVEHEQLKLVCPEININSKALVANNIKLTTSIINPEAFDQL